MNGVSFAQHQGESLIGRSLHGVIMSVVTIRTALLLAVLVWLSVYWRVAPHGYDLDIYRHNAELQIAHVNPYLRTGGSNYRAASYLDWTGAQQAVYVVVAYLDLKLWFLAPGTMWIALQAAWLALFLLILYRRAQLYQNDAMFILPVLLVVLHPAFIANLYLYGYEDKLSFLVIPLLALWLIESNRLPIAAAIAGASIGLNGTMLYFIPCFLIFAWQRKQLRICGALMLVAFAASMLPYFPESLHGWQNRTIRASGLHPYWYSIYSLLPFYFARLNLYIAGTGAMVIAVLFYFRRIQLQSALLVSVALLLVSSLEPGIDRLIPVAGLAIALPLRPRLLLAIPLWIAMLVFCVQSPSANVNASTIVAVHLALAGALIFYYVSVDSRHLTMLDCELRAGRLDYQQSPTVIHSTKVHLIR